MDETKKPAQNSMENNLTKSAFWGTIALNGVMLLVFGYFLAFFMQQERTPLIYIAMAIFLFALVAGLISLVFTIRGKQKQGAELSFYTLLGLGIAIIFIFQERVQTVSLSIFTISALAIVSLLPSQSRRQYWLAAGAAFIMMWVIEWIDPFWRIEANPTTLGPTAAAVFALVLIGLIFYQARKTVASSLRLKIMVWTGAIILVVSAFIITYSTLSTRQEAVENAQDESTFIARAEAENIKIQIEPAFETARVLATSFGAIKEAGNPITLTREQVNGILKKVSEENPSFLGTWTLWEPNAFDGLDASFANTPLHDETGRFIPYWVRTDENTVEGVAIIDYETEGLNPWYSIPRETRQVTLIPPYFYPINGVDVLMTTISHPIVENGEFYGVVGVDYPVAFVQGIVDDINLFGGTANAVLLTNEGSLVAVRNQPELALQPATSVFEDFDAIQTQLAGGETFVSISPDGQFLRVFAPVDLVSKEDWSFALIIPFSAIAATATDLAVQEGLIGAGLILMALLILWYLSGQIVRPIGDLTKTANAITQGNMNIVADVRSPDETGTLANAFNAMTAQLRTFIGTLEDRVAERTRGLELAAEVGRAVSQVRSLDVMLTDAAELIRAQFNLYYVQVYLINPGQTHLILEAGTGEAGKTLLERKHQLPLNTNSLNGRAAVERKSVVIENTLRSITFKPNPLLPDTRSEMAIPLMVGDKVVGVLDMQSMQEEGLKQELLPAFEALAGQLAIAIQNANLLAEAEQARTEVEAQARRLARSNWVEYLDAINMPERTGFIFEQNQVLPLNETETPQISEENAVVAPISITGEVVGSLVVELDENTSPAASESDLVEEVARQVALHIESLRLLETAERFRSEAEEASRRLTREGWKDYVQTHTDQPLSFYYDLNEVQPLRGMNTYQQDESALNLPLKVREETIGKLAIQGIDSDNSEALELANAVAERLSAHIESLRQFEETRRNQVELDKRAQELAAVAEISTISSKELDIQRMLETVVHLTQRKFGYYHAHVFLFDENKQHLKIAACGWKEGDEHEGSHGLAEISLMQEQSLVARAARSRTAVIVNDVRNEPGWLPNPLLPDTASELAVPLMIGDQLLGVLDVQSDRLDAFNEEDANIQATLASQVATALQNARSFDRAQKQAERESMLNAINQKIQSATSVESVLQIAARELGHALGAPMTIAQLSMKDTSS